MILPNSITLRPGDSGDYVTELQRRLAQRDLLSEMDITGFYDATTTRAIKTFQSANGLKVDGLAGPETLRLLINLGGDGDSSSSDYHSDNAEGQERTQGLDRYDEMVYLQEVTVERDIDVAIDAHTHSIATELLMAESLSKDAAAMTRDAAIKAVDMTEESLRKNQEQFQQQNQEIEQAKSHELAANKQLEITQQHIKAETLGDSLKKDPQTLEQEKEGRDKDKNQAKELDKSAEKEAAAKLEAEKSSAKEQEHQLEQTKQKDAAQKDQLQQQGQQQAQQQNQQQGQPQGQQQNLTSTGRERIPLDPSIQYVESRLSPSSQMMTHTEGERLYSQGVRESVMPPGMQLGDLVPSQTPHLGQRQQIGIGM